MCTRYCVLVKFEGRQHAVRIYSCVHFTTPHATYAHPASSLGSCPCHRLLAEEQSLTKVKQEQELLIAKLSDSSSGVWRGEGGEKLHPWCAGVHAYGAMTVHFATLQLDPTQAYLELELNG